MVGKPSANSQPKYFRVERFFFLLGGISLTGNEGLAYRIFSWVNLVGFNYMYPVVASIDLFKHNFFDAIENWYYVVATATVDLIIAAASRNRLKVGRLVQKLEQKPFLANKKRGGDIEEKLLGEWLSFTRNQAILFFVCAILCVVGQMVDTVVARIRSSDYHDWKTGFAKLSLVNTTYSPNYEITMLYQTLCASSLAFNICSITLIVSGVAANISTQFRLLQNNLKRMVYNARQEMLQDNAEALSLNDDTVKNNSEIPWKYLQISLKETVLYHLAILDVVRELEDIFSEVLLSLYVGTLTMLCLEVYRAAMLTVVDITAARSIMEMLTSIFSAMLICYSGQKMTNGSEGVPDAAFQSNFVGTDLRFQKSLVVIIRGSQSGVRIKAGKLIETSLVTFVWILRTAYYAYMVLRNTSVGK